MAIAKSIKGFTVLRDSRVAISTWHFLATNRRIRTVYHDVSSILSIQVRLRKRSELPAYVTRSIFTIHSRTQEHTWTKIRNYQIQFLNVIISMYCNRACHSFNYIAVTKIWSSSLLQVDEYAHVRVEPPQVNWKTSPNESFCPGWGTNPRGEGLNDYKLVT